MYESMVGRKVKLRVDVILASKWHSAQFKQWAEKNKGKTFTTQVESEDAHNRGLFVLEEDNKPVKWLIYEDFLELLPSCIENISGCGTESGN